VLAVISDRSKGETNDGRVAVLPSGRRSMDALDPWNTADSVRLHAGCPPASVQGATPAVGRWCSLHAGILNSYSTFTGAVLVSLLPSSRMDVTCMADKLYEVRDGSLVPFAPAFPVPGEQLFVAGKRLFVWTEG